MYLIIAEKPSVAKEIAAVVGASKRDVDKKGNGCFRGDKFTVSWCYGHLVKLAEPNEYNDVWNQKWSFEQLPMIPDNWIKQPAKESIAQFNVLKKLMYEAQHDKIICATDADREGECIFRYVYEMTGCKKPVRRLWISSLEASSIVNGLKTMKPMSDYDSLYKAGYCRARADWLMGMNATRLFTLKYGTLVTVGRVQTPTLSMVVQRDYEIDHFVKQKYFNVEIDCGEFKAASNRIDDEHDAELIRANCDGKTATVVDLKKETKYIPTPKLFDLTSLQREANKRFGYSAKQTLDAQQALYEAKLSTYPRTESQYITQDMVGPTETLINHLIHNMGVNFSKLSTLQPKLNVKQCANDKKVEGHPAILPTVNVNENVIARLDEKQRNILLLQIERLFQATYTRQKYETTKITLNCENTEFVASGKIIKEKGWKAVEQFFAMITKRTFKESKDVELPDLQVGQQFNSVKAGKIEKFTTPPSPYTEDTLLAAMEHAGQDEYDDDTEKKGLGTPATRAGILEELVNRKYLQREKKQIRSTDLGKAIINYVPEKVKSPKLTAEWENKLHQMELGEFTEDEFMSENEQYIVNLCNDPENRIVSGDAKSLVNSQHVILGTCPHCGGNIIKGKFGPYCESKCGIYVQKVMGKTLTDAELKKILDGKKVTLKNLTSKSGKKYDIIVDLDGVDEFKKNDGTVGYSMRFITSFPK